MSAAVMYLLCKVARFVTPQQHLKLHWQRWPNFSLWMFLSASGTVWSAIALSAAAHPVDPKLFVSSAQEFPVLLSQAEKPTESLSPSFNGESPLAQKESETPEAGEDPDLGRLRLRERRTPPPPPQPVLHIVPRISYFYTDNVFSGVDPVQDSLFFPGVTVWSAPELKPGTYLIASIDGNLIRYLNKSEFDYNYLRFRTGVYQRITPRLYGELGWSNQQYFRASNGDQFLNEHSIYLSLSRRDWLTRRLVLDSLYDVRLSFADPDSRSRLNNYLSLSLSYYFQPNLFAGFDYQLNFWDFTKRDRQDFFQRLLGRLTYGVSPDSQFNLQAGVSLGGSTDDNIDYDGLFFSLTYSVDLKVF